MFTFCYLLFMLLFQPHNAAEYMESVVSGLKIITEPRSYDGVGNNPHDPTRGSRETAYTRVDSGVEAPAGYVGANVATWVQQLEAQGVHARKISSGVCQQPPRSKPKCAEGTCKNTLFTTFGQMVALDLSHSLGHTPTEEINMPVPTGDSQFDKANAGNQNMKLKRSKYVLHPLSNVRKQINSNTHFLDAEAIYGYNEVYANALRTKSYGLLKTSAWDGLADYSDSAHTTTPMGNACPGRVNNNQLYMSGSKRVNLIPQLVAVHTLFVREHNRRAKYILEKHPTWEDESIYQSARKWVIALIQNIFYMEYLPQLLGTSIDAYNEYDSTLDPAVDIFAGTVALRYGHSEVPSVYGGNNDVPVLRDSFFHPKDYVYNNESFVSILRSMMESKQETVDPYVVDDVRHYTLSCDNQPKSDLAARNIQRGRDNGVPSYMAARATYGLPLYTSIDNITKNEEIRKKLKDTYGENNLNNIDPWVGALAEDPVNAASVGPLLKASLVKQFTRTRDADRFWYENVMSDDEIKEVQRYKFKDVIGNNAAESLRRCKSSPWIDTSHEICESKEDKNMNSLEINKSPHVGLNWKVLISTPGSEKIQFTFKFDVNAGKQGWMGMSIGSTDGGMTAADMIIVKKSDAEFDAGSSITVHDFYSTGYIEPAEDETSNVEIVSKSFVNNQVIVVFNRLGITGDETDAELKKSEPTFVAFAWGNDGSSSINPKMPYYHKLNRKGFGKVNFFSGQMDDNDTLKVVHGMIMSTIWMFNITMGVITARYRAESRSWFGTHVALQAMGTLLTFPMYFLAHYQFVLKSGSSWHSILGNIIVFTCSIQAFLGVHMAMLFEYRVQKELKKLDPDPSCCALLKFRWFDYLGEKINQPTCRTNCCCCFISLCLCCSKKKTIASSKKTKEMSLEMKNIDLNDEKMHENPSFKGISKDVVLNEENNQNALMKRNKVLKVRREIYLHYIHKFYGKLLLFLAYCQVALGLYTYGAFDEYLNEGKVPTGGKFVLCLLFLVWYVLIFLIFLYKEIMFRCGYASFSTFEFLDYLLDECIDSISYCLSKRCLCCCSKDETINQETDKKILRPIASVLDVRAPSNTCYAFAKIIQQESVFKEFPVAKIYRTHLKDFLVDVCNIDEAIVPYLKHAGVGSIAEVAFVVPERDLVKYTKLDVKIVKTMIRRARRIVGYVNGVNIAKANKNLKENELPGSLLQSEQFSFQGNPKMYLDGRELNEVANGPSRWDRSPSKMVKKSDDSGVMEIEVDEEKIVDTQMKDESTRSSEMRETAFLNSYSSFFSKPNELNGGGRKDRVRKNENKKLTSISVQQNESLVEEEQKKKSTVISEPEYDNMKQSSRPRTMTEPLDSLEDNDDADNNDDVETESDIELSDFDSDSNHGVGSVLSRKKSRHYEADTFWEDCNEKNGNDKHKVVEKNGNDKHKVIEKNGNDKHKVIDV